MLIPRFIEIQREIQRGSYELYAEVLRRTAVRVAAELGWELEPSRSNFLPDSVPRWLPFRETNAQLERFAKKYETGHPLEHRRQAAGRHPAPLPGGLRPGGHRAAGALLQARPGALQGVRAADRGRQEELGAHRRGYPTDVEPCLKQKIPVIWVNRHGEELESGQKKPDAEVKTFRDAGKLLKAA